MFLTIVTRCCQRPKMLGENIQSVINQSCHDVEQIFIVDHSRQGIQKADRALALNKGRVDGEWVYIMDDDCQLLDNHFIETAKDIGQESQLDIIMVKSRRPPGPPSRQSIVPTPNVWGGVLRHGSCNCLCYVMRNHLWKKHIHHFGRKPWGGDWWFLSAVLDTSPRMYWIDRIVADARQLGRGKKFETESKDWFLPIAEQYNLEEVEKGDWRLRLWTKDLNKQSND